MKSFPNYPAMSKLYHHIFFLIHLIYLDLKKNSEPWLYFVILNFQLNLCFAISSPKQMEVIKRWTCRCLLPLPRQNSFISFQVVKMLILLLILFVLTWTPGLIYEALVAFQRHFPGAVGMFTIIIRHVSHPGSPLYWLGCLLTITDILLPKTVFYWEERTRSTCHPDTNDDILQLKGFWSHMMPPCLRVHSRCHH